MLKGNLSLAIIFLVAARPRWIKYSTGLLRLVLSQYTKKILTEIYGANIVDITSRFIYIDGMNEPTAKKEFAFETLEQKASYVQDMFNRIAPRYDLMNRVMTLGRDQAWRRLLVKRAGVKPGARVLDIATGTADLAVAARNAGAAKIVAADFSLQMLAHAQAKIERQDSSPFLLAAADGLHLPFHDNSFDAVVTGFSLRNVGDLDHFLREMARVTRSGGWVACLEIYSPTLPGFRSFFRWYFGKVVPRIGAWLVQTHDAYNYLPYSVSVFVSPAELRDRLLAVGLQSCGYESLMLGSIAVHYGRKP